MDRSRPIYARVLFVGADWSYTPPIDRPYLVARLSPRAGLYRALCHHAHDWSALSRCPPFTVTPVGADYELSRPEPGLARVILSAEAASPERSEWGRILALADGDSSLRSEW